MSTDHAQPDQGAPTGAESPLSWRESRRLRYNAGLVIAGILAFIAYVTVCSTSLPRVLPPGEIEVSLFTTLVQEIGYLCAMLVANILYFLGALSEHLIRPRNVDRYRRIAYALGFWFSVLLPFAIPASLVIMIVFFPDTWQTAPDQPLR